MEKSLVLEMKNITKTFPGVIANEDVNLQLHKGEVLALLGENGAGKSTLMNMIVGLYRPDKGDVYVNSKHVVINSPQDSMALGIGMIHQEFMLVGNLTVAENIILGLKDLPTVPPIAEINKKIIELSKKYELKVDPTTLVENLTVGEQQRVEILKLLYRGADILILDEPTAVLTPKESQELNKILKKMLSEGKSAIFITHKMIEVLEFSDTLMVLRKGKCVGIKPTKEIKELSEIANLMVGRPVLFDYHKEPFNPGEVKVELKNVSVNSKNHSRKTLDNISFSIRAGEILGIAGVAGNGQQPLSEVITGLLKVNEGNIYLNGKDYTNKTPLQIINAGLSHIPADRGRMGIVGDMSVGENLSMKKYRTEELSHNHVIIKSKVREFATRLINKFVIKTPNQYTSAKFLSGGNIQKTILAREINSCKGILIAVYPSRGLDVGATEAVRKNIIAQREKGTAILLVSEELDELRTVCDKIAVMFEGKIMDIMDSENASTEEIGLLMAGVQRS